MNSNIPNCRYRIAIDGGGTTTRARVLDTLSGQVMNGRADTSGLMHGAERAWDAIARAIAAALGHRTNLAHEDCALVIGIAGANHPGWLRGFLDTAPKFAYIQAETDIYTALLGAHRGMPGIAIIAGTGSVGEALHADGRRTVVGGWGFPSGDQGGGAWIGLQAIQYVERMFDGRQPRDRLADQVIAHCGGDRLSLLEWVCAADQTRFATLAPIVFYAAAESEVAADIIMRAANEVTHMAASLDPSHSLPIALCGSVAQRLNPWLPSRLRERMVTPAGDALDGAFLLLQPAHETSRGQSLAATQGFAA